MEPDDGDLELMAVWTTVKILKYVRGRLPNDSVMFIEFFPLPYMGNKDLILWSYVWTPDGGLMTFEEWLGGLQ